MDCVWRSLITCGDVSSDTLEILGLNPCGSGAEEDAVGFAKTCPDDPCVSQVLGMRVPNVWRLIAAAQHSQRTAWHSARILKRWEKTQVDW